MLFLWEGGAANQTVSPGAIALASAPIAPTFIVPQAVLPASLALAATAVAPTFVVPQTVSPGALALASSAVAPRTDLALAPTAIALASSPVAPVVLGGASLNLLKAWGFELNSATDEVEFNWTGAPTIVTSPVRTGNYAMRCNPTGGVGKGIQEAISADTSDVWFYAQTAFYIAAAPDALATVVGFYSNALAVRGRLRLNTDRTVGLFANATQYGGYSSALPLNEWHVLTLAVRHNSSTARTEMAGYLDGVLFASTTTGTQNVGAIGLVQCGVPTAGINADLYIDDVIVATDQNGGQIPTPEMRVAIARPNGAGDSGGWARGGADSGANWSQVEELPPNDATNYVESSTLNAEDLYAMGSPVAAGDLIYVVTTEGRFTTDNVTGTPGFKFELEKTGSGTKLQSAEITPIATSWVTNDADAAPPRLPPIIAKADPDGGGWTSTTVGSMQAGVKITADPGAAFVRLTALWSYVVYVPAPRTVEPAAVALAAAPVAPRADMAVAPASVSLASSPTSPTFIVPQSVLPAAIGLTSAPAAARIDTQLRPTVLSLASAAVAPRVDPSVSPPALTVTSAPLAPIVVFAQSVSPAALGLASAAVAPRIDEQVRPGVIALASAAVAPRADLSVAPSALALAATLAGPTLIYPQFLTPAALALSLGILVPDLPVLVTPATLALAIALAEPGFGREVRPGVVALAASPLAGQLDQVVMPSLLTAATTLLIPTVGAGLFVTPAEIALLAALTEPARLDQQVRPGALGILVTPGSFFIGFTALEATPSGGRGDLVARLTIVGAGMPLLVAAYDSQFNPPRLIHFLEGARDATWLEQLSEVGSGSFRIPRFDPKAGPRVIAKGNIAKMWLHGRPQFAWVMEQIGQTIASTEGQAGDWLSVGGPSAMSLLGRSRIASPDRSLYGYVAVLLKDLIAEAATTARPVLSLITADWTLTLDSAGLPWNDQAQWAFPWGTTTLLDVLRAAASVGVEFRMTPDLVLEAYEEGFGERLESQIILRPGKHLREAIQFAEDEGRWLNRVSVKGGSGATMTVYGSHGDARRGIREGFVEFQATNEPGVLLRAGDAAIAASEALAQAFKVPVFHGTGPGEWEPYLDYRVGDWLALDVPGKFDRLPFRVASATVSATEGGGYQVDLDANAVRLDNIVRLKKLIEDGRSQLVSFAGL